MIDRDSSPTLSPREAVLYWTGFAGEYYFRSELFGRVRGRVEDRLLRQGLPERGVGSVPSIDPRAITPRAFREDWVQAYAPVVMKGFGSSWPAFRKWTPEFFQSRYGNEKVCVRLKSAGLGPESVYAREVTVAQFVEDILSGGESYASNLEDLFNANPELRDDLDIPGLLPYSCADAARVARRSRRWRIPKRGEILSTQIFISNGRGRTGYHCAIGGNFFLQVYGRKRWLFVNPRHTAFMHPYVRKDFLYSASAIDPRLSREDLTRQGFPLYDFAPKYEVVLEPGDLLYSPQWWWHQVDNLGDSIGVAMRFRNDMFAGNPMYSAMAICSKTVLRYWYEIFRTGWGSDTAAVRKLFEPEGRKLDIRLPEQEQHHS